MIDPILALNNLLRAIDEVGRVQPYRHEAANNQIDRDKVTIFTALLTDLKHEVHQKIQDIQRQQIVQALQEPTVGTIH